MATQTLLRLINLNYNWLYMNYKFGSLNQLFKYASVSCKSSQVKPDLVHWKGQVFPNSKYKLAHMHIYLFQRHAIHRHHVHVCAASPLVPSLNINTFEIESSDDNSVRLTINFDAAFTRDNVIDSYCVKSCLLYTSPSPRDATLSRMPSSA